MELNMETFQSRRVAYTFHCRALAKVPSNCRQEMDSFLCVKWDGIQGFEEKKAELLAPSEPHRLKRQISKTSISF